MSNLRKPVRNIPSVGDRHKCALTAVVNGETIDLTDETACKQAGLENGMIFTDEDIVTVAGKQQACGKEWVLHYPTKFAWKVRRAAKDGAAPVVESQPEAQAQETASAGKRKH